MTSNKTFDKGIIIKINGLYEFMEMVNTDTVEEVHELLKEKINFNDEYVYIFIEGKFYRTNGKKLQPFKHDIHYFWAIELFLTEKFGIEITRKFLATPHYYSDLHKNINPNIHKHLITQFKYHIHYNILNEIYDLLSASNLVKYMTWVCKLIKNGKLKDEDFTKTVDLLKTFNLPKVKAKLKQINKHDINGYSTINYLYHVLDTNDLLDVAETKQDLIDNNTIWEDNHHVVVEVKNHNDSCEIGSGTNWCTAKDNQDSLSSFNYYSDNGDQPLIVVIDKDNPKEKWQFAPHTGDFLDKNDNEFEIVDTFSNDLLLYLIDEYGLVDVKTLLHFELNDKVRQIIEDELSASSDNWTSQTIIDILAHKKAYLFIKDMIEYVDNDVNEETLDNIIDVVKKFNDFDLIDNVTSLLNYIDNPDESDIINYYANIWANSSEPKRKIIIETLINYHHNDIGNKMIISLLNKDELRPYLSQLLNNAGEEINYFINDLLHLKYFSKTEITKVLIDNYLDDEDILEECELIETHEELTSKENEDKLEIIDTRENDDSIKIKHYAGSVIITESYDFSDYDDEYENEMTIYIQNIQVDEDFRRQGIGTELMEAAIALIENKYPNNLIWLNASNNHPGEISNDELAEWYSRFGFEIYKKEKNNIIMIKNE